MYGKRLGISIALVSVAVMLSTVAACSGDGGSDSPTSPSGGTVGATIVLSANGVSDAAPRIATGQRVRFTNNDTVVHQILTTPHNLHSDCPALNSIDVIQPGQSKESGVLSERRGCGFHDHLSPDDQRFRGQVVVGLSTSDPDPSPPGY